MADDSDSLDILEYLQDVRANTEISSSLPIYLLDASNARATFVTDSAVKRATSNNQTTSQLRAMGLLDRQLDRFGGSFPNDSQLPIGQVLVDGSVHRLVVDWDAPWLPCLQLDEVLR